MNRKGKGIKWDGNFFSVQFFKRNVEQLLH